MRIFDADVTGSLHVSGSSNFKGGVTVSGSQTVTGSLTVHGNAKLGDQLTDTHTVTGSLKVTGSISGSLTGALRTDYIDFNTGSTIVGAVGRLTWNPDERTLDLGMGGGNSTQQIGQELYYPPVFNGDSIDLINGTVVMVDPLDVSHGDRLNVIRAVADGSVPSKLFVGILTENVGQNDIGFATWFGLVRGLHTGDLEANNLKDPAETWFEGTLLYADPTRPGGLTSTEPGAPDLKVTIAAVTRLYGNNVDIMVRPDLNKFLGELNDVNFTSVTDSNLIVRSGSQWVNSNTLSGSYVVSGSLDVVGTQTINGNQIISGSITITQNISVLGTSSFVYVTSSNLNLTGPFIYTNVFEPVERFGGLVVFDSGSESHLATASLLWDSLNNHWIYQNASGSSYSGGMLLSGPRNTGSLGQEVGLTSTRIPKSVGGDHLDNSNIYDTGTVVKIVSNTEITGSLKVTGGIQGLIDYNYVTNVPSFITGYTETQTLQDVTTLGSVTTNDITARSFIVTGGAGHQFLKADGTLDGSTYLTQHPTIIAAASSNNSGRTYIQDILLDANGHVTGVTTATETVVDTNTYVTGATFNTGNGIITLTKNDGNTVTVDIDGRFLTSYTETQTLQDVTTLGHVTTTDIEARSFIITGGNSSQFLKGDGSLDTNTYLTSASLNGYATTGYVQTQITNLIDSAPSTLDTLNELAAALGDDPNFATTVATSIGNKVSKSGDTMTGDLNIYKNNTTLTLGQLNTSTGFTTIQMYAGGGGSFNGYSIRYNKDTSFDRLEFVDGGGTARIYFENGGILNAATIVKTGGLSTQFLMADGSVSTNPGWLTAHPSVTAASSSNNSGRTYIQDILLDQYGHITGITTATETVVDTNNYTTGATFNTSDGVVTFTRNDGNTFTVDLDGRYQASGSYLTSESDTLATVTARGNTTTTSITVSGLTSNNDVTISGGTLTVYESVSGATVFAVDGTNGRLFAVTDDLSNSLFSVNTISGLPVIEAFADYHVVMGRFNQNDFYLGTTGEIGMGIVPVSGYKLAVSGNVRATSFVKSGGTSSQFLMADGSVSTNPGWLTAHPSVSAASSSNNSGRTYIQDILLDSFGHITGITTASETVTDTNYYTTGATFNTGDGVVTFTRNDGNTFTVDLDGRYGTSSTDYYTTGATFNTSDGVITYTRNYGGTYTVDIDGRFLTAHPSVTAASSSNNSGRTYIQDILLDSFGHITGITTATETVVDTNDYINNVQLVGSTLRFTGSGGSAFTGDIDLSSFLDNTNYYTTGATFNTGNGIVTFTRNDGGTYTVDLDGRYGTSSTDYYTTGATFNTSNGIITYTRNDGGTYTVDIDGKYLDSSSYTAADVLSKLLTVDGSGSGLDADTLDGNNSSYFYAASNPSGYISSYLNYFTTGATFNTSNGVITFSRNDGNTYTVDIDGRFSTTDHTHDDRYLPYEATSDTAKNSGWYTIAVNAGNRATGKFLLRDTSSGNHQSTVFYATHHFGTYSDITVLINSFYGGSPFRYIRIVDGGTYDGALLQVYVDLDNSQVKAWLLEDIQNAGWIIKDWIPDGVDPGDVTNFPAMTETPAQVDLDNNSTGGIITTGEIYGGGNTTQYQYLNTNNYSSTLDGRYYTETEIGAFFGGSTSITGYNKSNWDTAYGWGNHATQGYATTGYVQTQITNLIDGAPTALDTLNELAAALGDDANFATTITTSIGNKLPLSGGTMTGNIAFGATSNLGLTWGLNTDAAFIRFISTSNAAGGSYLEIGTQDDNDEEIKFSQSGTVRFLLATDGYLKTGGGAKYVYESGTWGIDISGNSATVTNGVYTNGSYSNPSWITALAGSKITGNISGNASNITSYTINQDLGTSNSVSFSAVASPVYYTTTSSTRSKISLWGSDSNYTIGMESGVSYGGLNDYAMTFQFNNEDDRGFWWGDTSHSTAQGAMALTTNGYLTVARGVRVGYGESDTTTPTVPLQVYGSGSLVFDVQGSLGQLFSVTDSLSGSLFSVNDISGLPVLEVFSDDRVVMGSFGMNSLVVSGTTTTVSGSFAVSGSATVNGGTVWHSSNDGSGSGLDADTLDGYHASSFLTAHPSISAASSVNNSGRTYIQDITLDSNGHVTGIVSATETVTDTNDYISNVQLAGSTLEFTAVGSAFGGSVDLSSIVTDTNYYTTSASFNTSNGIITFSRNDGGTYTVDLDGKYLDSSSYTAADVLSKLLTVDGSGTSLDADLLDGQHGSYYYPASNPNNYISSYTDTNYYLSSASFNTSDGVLTLTVTGYGNVTVDLDGRYQASGSYLTSESDTLATVTTRGASTTNDITIGGLTVGGSLSRGTYTSASNYVTGADNIVLKGNSSGVSGIFFESEKDGTNINHASDFGFIQFHPYGIGGSSGESNRLVIGVSNDSDDYIVLNPSVSGGLVVRVGAGTTEYVVYHAGNIPTWNQDTTGNAATATYATSAGSATSASTAGYADEAKWISFPDGPRDLSDRRPNWNNRSVAWDFVGAGTANGSGNYGGVMTFSPWDGTSSSTGDSSYQLAFANASGVNASGQPKLSIRNGIDTTWNSWYTLIHEGNISSYTSAHISVSAASSSNNSGRTYIQDILLDSYGHITGITTATETVVDTDTNYYTTSASFNTSNGIITFTRNDGGTYTVDIDGKYQEAGTYLGAINYNNDSGGSYQVLWGSGNAAYGTAGFYVTPSNDYVYGTSFNASDWFRSTGSSGWYSETYGGGIYMTESTMVKIYNNKGLYIDGGTTNTSSDGTLYVTATNNNDWLAIFNAYNSSKTEYGVYVRISSGASYGYALMTDGSTWTYRVDGSGRVYAPIYYDINDTAYYLNPASTSNLATVKLNSAASGTEVFTVDGVNGRLFTITDDLSDSLFSVNTIAGVPVIEAFSDYRVVMGRYNQNDFNINASGQVAIGTTPLNSYKFTVYGGQWGSYFRGGDTGTGSDIARFADINGTTQFLVRGDGVAHSTTYLSVGAINTGYNFYNNGTSYFNGAVVVDDNLTINGGYALKGAYGSWTGEENKIQWHSNNLYFQNTGGGEFIFRNSGGTNVFRITNAGVVYASSDINGAYILGSYFNASAGNSENPTIGQIWTQNTSDNYLRKSTPAHFISQLGLITTSNIGSQSVSSASQVTINYNNDSNSTYQVLWGSGNSVYGTGGVYVNPYYDYMYATAFVSSIFGLQDGTPMDCYMQISDENPTEDGINYGAQFFFYGDQSTSSSHLYFGGALIYNNLVVNGRITENSSIRYKKDIVQIENGLDKVLQLSGVTYTKINNEQKEAGVIAEEVAKILPEAVGFDTEGRPDSVSYGRLTALLIEAIKDLKKEIDELKGNK
jgi:hypothetical protein